MACFWPDGERRGVASEQSAIVFVRARFDDSDVPLTGGLTWVWDFALFWLVSSAVEFWCMSEEGFLAIPFSVRSRAVC